MSCLVKFIFWFTDYLGSSHITDNDNDSPAHVYKSVNSSN